MSCLLSGNAFAFNIPLFGQDCNVPENYLSTFQTWEPECTNNTTYTTSEERIIGDSLLALYCIALCNFNEKQGTPYGGVPA
jgi:hypothetical protein